jgi:hypothetical protein
MTIERPMFPPVAESSVVEFPKKPIKSAKRKSALGRHKAQRAGSCAEQEDAKGRDRYPRTMRQLEIPGVETKREGHERSWALGGMIAASQQDLLMQRCSCRAKG